MHSVSLSHKAGSLWTQFITFFDVKSSFPMAFFKLNYIIISTSNQIRNENPASTGSLARSKRFFLHFICLARARTNEPSCCEPAASIYMSRLMQQVRDQVFDKKVESWSKACRKPAGTCRKPGRKPSRKPGF